MTRILSLLVGVLMTASVAAAQTPVQRIDTIKADLAAAQAAAAAAHASVIAKLDALRAQLLVQPPPPPPPPPLPPPPPSGGPTPTGTKIFTCTFAASPTECGFSVQQKAAGRATIVSGGRDGNTAVRLQTEKGDSNVYGSGSGERTDLSLNQSTTGCYQGREQWWEHSIWFPNDFNVAANGWYVVMDFHNTADQGGQANFHVDASRFNGPTLGLRGYGGGSADAGLYQVTLGPIVKNQWYDFVHHVKWSSGADGYMQTWVNGVQKLNHKGPTLYQGQGCYLKLANYHTASGQSSAVHHDRVIRWDVP